MSGVNPLACPHCAAQMFKATADGTRLRARTPIIVLHKGTNAVEINCAACGRGVYLPFEIKGESATLSKALPAPPLRLVVPKA